MPKYHRYKNKPGGYWIGRTSDGKYYTSSSKPNSEGAAAGAGGLLVVGCLAFFVWSIFFNKPAQKPNNSYASPTVTVFTKNYETGACAGGCRTHKAGCDIKGNVSYTTARKSTTYPVANTMLPQS